MRLNHLPGVLFILVFLSLLFLRLGILDERKGNQRESLSAANAWSDRENWMNIFQQDQKIGHAHRQFFETPDGYRILESVVMRINMMGMVQDISLRTEGNFDYDFLLSSFYFELQSNLFGFTARGIRKDKTLTLFTGKGGSEQRFDYPFEKETYLSLGMLDLVYRNLKMGESRTIDIFDPATAAKRPVRIEMVGEETIPIMGRQEKSRKILIQLMSLSQYVWIDEDGTVLKEEGPLGIRLVRVSKDDALGRIAGLQSRDLVEVASIPSNRVLGSPGELSLLRVRLDGIEGGEVLLQGGRQSLKDGVLTVRKETISGHSSMRKEAGPEEKGYLLPSPLIQSDHAEIRAKAMEIVSANDSPFEKAKKLVAWVTKSIEKRPVLSVPDALETLRARMGDCNEHAVLLAALARASGIPAQVEAGLVYQEGRFYYHAWNLLFLGTWVTADAVMGQMPADVSHIRFVRSTENQIDLVGLIGKVRLEVLEASP
ncbi:MAG: hypothetical protein A2170_09705 [Deltaproteobacteria bacterium RBG_13_53_10]|nr:MAG: hypothetical protein A2170_09705 [Deltaproteobacteria bacterium RBG_13_53_10]